MKVGAQAVDVHTTALTSLPEFSQYQTVVVLMSNLDALGKRLIDLMNWVQNMAMEAGLTSVRGR